VFDKSNESRGNHFDAAAVIQHSGDLHPKFKPGGQSMIQQTTEAEDVVPSLVDLGELDPAKLSPSAAAAVEAAARETLRCYWRRSDALPVYPETTERVVEMLGECQYAIDADSLQRLIDAGAFASPPMQGGRRRWSATDIMRLVTLMETRRQWKPFSSLHDPKKSRGQLALEQARAAGDVSSVIGDLDKFDLRQLLILCVETEHRELREAVFAIVQAKLERDHDITL
jgi:hypothetical protein